VNRELIPFNLPYIPQSGREHLAQALASGQHAGDGRYSRECADLLAREIGVAKVLMTPSCTAALEMCALLLDLRAGDEVIFPAYTFVSTVNAFVLRGIRPIFCDSRLDTINIDERRIECLITDRTRAVVVVHYGGVSCEMDLITDLCARRGLTLIEDLAHGPFATYRGRPLGTFGAMSTLSFHQTKNFTCGEGGALLLREPRFLERAEIIREKGTNRSRFFRGQVDKYTWVDQGSSYLLADLLAALLLGGLEEKDAIQRQRMNHWNHYLDGLQNACRISGIGTPLIPDGISHSAHIFPLIMESLERRQDFIGFMQKRGIACPFHYQSLPETPMGLTYGNQQDDCPIARCLSDQLVRLPLWHGLGDQQVDRVIAAVLSFLGGDL